MLNHDDTVIHKHKFGFLVPILKPVKSPKILGNQNVSGFIYKT